MQRFILPRMASRACPLPSSFPPGSGVSSLQGRKILSMETRTEENDGELLFCPMGHSYVSILPTHPSSPLLSSKRLGLFPSNKVRPGKKEADADPLTRNGHIPVSVSRFSFLSAARHPLRPYVRAHSAGIFQRNARARTPFRESWRENESRDAGGSGGRGPGCACRVV